MYLSTSSEVSGGLIICLAEFIMGDPPVN